MYIYTALYQDGTTEELGRSAKKWKYEKIKEFIGGYIEYLPDSYFPEGMRGQVIGDEEGRFKAGNKRNPHMKVVVDPNGGQWDCVGDLLLEQTEKQSIKWTSRGA